MIDDDEDDERAAELAQDERDFIAAENARRRERAGFRSESDDDVNICGVDIDHPVKAALNGSVHSWPVVSARRRSERQAVANALMDYGVPEWPHYFVTLIRFGANRMDDDGLASSLKSFRDQTAVWLNLDDADPRVTWSCAQKIERVPDPRRPGKFRSYCRILVGRTAALVASQLGGATLALDPADEARQVAPQSKGARSARPAPPEIQGGTVERTIELPIRKGSSRLTLTLRRLTKPSGRGHSDPAGLVYVLVSLAWEDRKGSWRTQGVAVRLNEVDAVIAGLRDLTAVH